MSLGKLNIEGEFVLRMPYTLHVINLPRTLTSEGLQALFAPFGTVVSARIIKDFDDKSVGLGVVEMSCAEEADAILQARDTISVGGMRRIFGDPRVLRKPDAANNRTVVYYCLPDTVDPRAPKGK